MSDPALDTSRPLRRVEAAAYIRDRYNLPCEASSLRTRPARAPARRSVAAADSRLYSPVDLDAWVSAKTSPKVRSTSELTALRAVSQSIPAHVGP